MVYVVKLGGDCNATAEAVDKSVDFVLANAKRRVVVTSAPGKRPCDEVKLTQLLYKAALDNMQRKDIVKKVEQRFSDILDPLGINFDVIEKEFDHLEEILSRFDINNPSHVDELKFFGERCQQYVIGEHLKNKGSKVKVVTPWNFGVIVEEDHGVIRFSPVSYKFIRDVYQSLADDEILVTAGFGGYDKFGNLRTLPFGGTDVSAAHIARAIDAELYENVKCVDGYANIDPKLVKGTDLEKFVIHHEYVRFDEAIEASAGGASVIHADALTPCKGNKNRKEIPIRVCNLYHPEKKGTIITDNVNHADINQKYINPNKFVTKKDGYYLVTITDDAMINAQSYAAEVQLKLGARHIPYAHISSSENSFTLAIHGESFGYDEKRLRDYKFEVEALFPGAKVSYESGISMICVVNSRTKTPGILAKAAVALGMNGINIEFVSQAKERAMIFGVSSELSERAVIEIAREFYSDKQYLPGLPKFSRNNE